MCFLNFSERNNNNLIQKFSLMHNVDTLGYFYGIIIYTRPVLAEL